MRVRSRVDASTYSGWYGQPRTGKLCDIVIGVINLDLSSVGTTKLSTDRPADQIILQTRLQTASELLLLGGVKRKPVLNLVPVQLCAATCTVQLCARIRKKRGKRVSQMLKC